MVLYFIEMVWYQLHWCLYNNRTLHGRLEIPNFSSSVKKYFPLGFERQEKEEEKRNFVSPSGHVISSFSSHYAKLEAIPIKCFVSHRPPSREGGLIGRAKKNKIKKKT